MYDTIIEPYAGSAGYSLNHCDKAVGLYDANLLVTDLWRWIIQDATSDLVREIPLHLTEGTDIKSLGLTYGQSLLLKHWQRTNNVGNCWTISPWGLLDIRW